MSSAIPRISREDLPQDLASFLRPRIERLGYLGEFFQCTAHQPDALLSFLEYTEHLKRALPSNLTELVSLTIAQLMENAYERVQHERLSLRLGFSTQWIEAVLNLSPDTEPELSADEQDVQRLVMAMVQRFGHETDVELEAALRAIGVAETIAVLMLTGRYISHALIANALKLAPPVASPLGTR